MEAPKRVPLSLLFFGIKETRKIHSDDLFNLFTQQKPSFQDRSLYKQAAGSAKSFILSLSYFLHQFNHLEQLAVRLHLHTLPTSRKCVLHLSLQLPFPLLV